MKTQLSTFSHIYLLDQKIMEILDEDIANEEYLLEKIKKLEFADKSPKNVYSSLLRIFTSMEFAEEEAEEIWFHIVEYKKELSSQLKRDIGFRVAMLDYFINVNKKLVNPKIIEIRLFLETEKLVLIDELTKLYNRRHFQNSIHREFKQAKRYNFPLSLLIIDVDNFKKLNDTYGHAKGDEALVELGRAIKGCMREEDTSCRIGGEEFAIILPQTDEKRALLAGNKLLEAVRKISIEGHQVTFSGGLVSYPEKVSNVDELYDLADKALYYAKYSGKNRVVAFSGDKRGSHRFNANLEILCQFPDRKIKTISKNISVTGIAFDTEEDVSLQDNLDIKLKDDITGEMIDAKIKIVRKEKGENGKFVVGAEFVEICDNGKKILSELIQRR